MTDVDEVYRADMHTVRRAISRHLVGSGIELGPGPHPFPVEHTGVTVAYVDRWDPDENRALFSELAAYDFVEPDVACDLNVDRLRKFDDESQDFVIASHVLEHMADPLGLLDDIHRVLRPGGVALILLPDMRRTFDRGRPVTPVDHVVADFEGAMTDVEDAHIDEFLRFTEDDYDEAVGRLDPEARRELFAWHRQRSIHVHCWSETDFVPVLDHAIAELGHRWEFVDGILTDDEGPDGFEFGYVLHRCAVDLPAGTLRSRFHSTYETWAAGRRQIHALRSALADTRRSLDETRGAFAHVEGVLAQTRAELAGRNPLWRHALTDARDVAGRARRGVSARLAPR